MPLQFKSEKELVNFIVNAKLPAWQADLFKQYSDAIQVHSRGEVFFKISSLFPNEHPDSKDHRLLAFESITEGSFGRAANNVNRIFKNSSFTVDASEKTIAYSTENNFYGQNLYNWFLDEWVRIALKEDANARIVVYPPDYVKEGHKEIVFVESCFIKHLSPDDFVFVSEEESEVEYNLETIAHERQFFYDQSIKGPNFKETAKNTYTPKLKSTIKRYVYHAFFKGVGFYRVEQLKAGQGYQVDFFPIKEDFLPVVMVGGELGKNKVCKSFLHPFVPFGNLALLQHSQHTAVNFTFSFPRMSELQTPCDAEGCNEGIVECVLPEDVKLFGPNKKCTRCGGSGFTTNQTPYKIYQKKYDPSAMEGDQKYLTVPDVQYYTPDTGILDYSKEEWKNYLELAETAVYISQRVKTGNVESAESKNIDRDDLYSFLYKVGQTYFNKLKFVVQALENYYIGSPTKVNVNIPYSYAILSEGEAFTALKDILSSNIPVMIKANQVQSFINKFVSQSSPIRKFLDVLMLVDPLLYYTTNEISSFKASNIVSEEQFANHVFSFPILQKMYQQDKNILINNEAEKVAELVKTELEAYKPKPVEDLKTKLLNENAK